MNATVARFAAAGLAAGSLLAAAPALAKPAECRFVFEGTAYIDGGCELKTADSGSFRVEADGYLVQIDLEGDNLATGRWNGDVRAGQLQRPLHGEGELTRAEACWTGKAAQLCVWQPGERKEPKPAKLPRLEARDYGDGADGAVGSWNLVAVAKNGRFDHCYGLVPGDRELRQGPLKLALDAAGGWSLSAPAAGMEPGFRSTFDIEYHKASGSIDGQVDSVGQRMNLTVTNEVLKGLVGAAEISLGYAPDMLYRLKKTGPAIKQLQECRARFLKQWPEGAPRDAAAVEAGAAAGQPAAEPSGAEAEATTTTTPAEAKSRATTAKRSKAQAEPKPKPKPEETAVPSQPAAKPQEKAARASARPGDAAAAQR